MENHTHLTLAGGIIGGLVGGILFGIVMFMMGMMPMIAMMIGSESVVIGGILHLIISALTGALFVLAFAKRVHGLSSATMYGAIYGVIWWVLGALIIMPVILGMGVQFASMFDQMRLMSLMGHLVFGVVLAITALKVSK